ncbi:hypothetical protein SPRG_00098 [Saprolegnia parasitica CBS 223.65]|uniref:Uncharacterized protein n=1 Tax=Saprolegnia parasitica (strain CBS 223.65) TaxID=695850 RepID=A0A067D8C9_SAPPC|nr:hypothetical protein SPRG_00098 [Saprolegnia parasitica CBS 223.65]KDO35252.1 hypothetical protein SPRG_00098 [Saprolegnia parasitica CBS 223.65]|eukprot:XP_012193603.1 hypothetical protein SPRG_00098 [Saprolegnia parasitica CBS 223.65]
MTTFACLALMKHDLLRLVGFPPEANNWISQAITRSWPEGIWSSQPRSRCFEFKLGGSPWVPNGRSTVHARYLMLEILIVLKRHGYTLHSSSDISNSQYTRDTLVFRHGIAEESPTMFAISTNSSDLLRLLRAPVELQPVMAQLIARYWPAGLQRKTLDYVPGCAEFKFSGYPWSFNGDDSIDARIFLLHLFAKLEELGWFLYGSIGQSSNGEGYAKDTWFFHYIAPNAVPLAVPLQKNAGYPMAPASAPEFFK